MNQYVQLSARERGSALRAASGLYVFEAESKIDCSIVVFGLAQLEQKGQTQLQAELADEMSLSMIRAIQGQLFFELLNIADKILDRSVQELASAFVFICHTLS